MESKWIKDSLFAGLTANAFKLGTVLTLGWFWSRVSGGAVLYRGSSMETIDFENVLVVAEAIASVISPPSYIQHSSNSTYFYVVRQVNNCGKEEYTLAAAVKVSIDANGDLAQPQPNDVFDIRAKQLETNKVELLWYYCPIEQKAEPIKFNIYYDGGTGQIDYENPIAVVAYVGRKFYSYQSGGLGAGRYLFCIRTEDAAGIEDESLAQLRIQLNTITPEAISILNAEAV